MPRILNAVIRDFYDFGPQNYLILQQILGYIERGFLPVIFAKSSVANLMREQY